VAADRRVQEIGPEPPLPSLTADDHEWAEWRRLFHKYANEIFSGETQPIGGPRDGEHRTFQTWADLLAYVGDVAADGYRVPDWVVGTIQREVGNSPQAAPADKIP
jgi:hypothetical protein